eukprot:scaffold1727_cov133-Cylindrotheca_fusiformis.AAC.7
MSFRTPSPQKRAMDRRQLIKPSKHIPWSVNVVSAVPKIIADKMLHHHDEITASASCPGWACVSTKDGLVWIWQHTTSSPSSSSIISSTGSSSSLMSNINNNSSTGAIEPPKAHKVYFPDLMNPTKPPKLALTGDGESVNLYALCGGWLLLRKLTTKDWTARVSMRAYTAKLRLVLDNDDNDDEKKETILSLTTAPSGTPSSLLVVLASSTGNLYWVTHTAVPVGLQLQKIVPPPSGIWNRFLGSNSSSSHHNIATAAATSHGQWVLPMDSSHFWAISTTSITKWKVERTTTQPIFEIQSKHATWGSSEFHMKTILEATLLVAGESAILHCIVQGVPTSTQRQEQGQETAKLYWLQVDLYQGTIQKSHWLSRFGDPASVQTLGLACTPNGDAYAAFKSTQSTNVVVMVLLSGSEELLQEVDLPQAQVPMLVPNMFQSDIVTHGCHMVATSGIGIRARYLSSDGNSPQKNRRLKQHSNSVINVTSLMNHLRSFFWQCYQNPGPSFKNMPPSLQQASQDDLEYAIVQFGYELQHKGDTSSANNPMEWHKAFCELLQQRGLYRNLSLSTQWQLLGMGQELAVFAQLARMPGSATTFLDDEPLRPYEIGQWLLDCFMASSTLPSDDQAKWNELLTNALETAAAYREEMALPIYDIADASLSGNGMTPPSLDGVALWTSHKSLQQLLQLQLEEWKRTNAASSEGSTIDLVHIEAIVKAALVSYSESTDEEGKKLYPKIRAMAIDLLRATSEDDELAFELSIQYSYFQGLCRISVDHEKKLDAATYSLDPLFARISTIDIESRFSFSQYVLQWHTDNGLYGHAINYGRHSPSDLRLLMDKDERLRKYRWIPAIRQQYYQQATESCLAFGDTNNFANHQWSLSMAKLSNKLLANQNSERTRTIEKQLELVDAQQMLMDENTKTENRLMAPEELVQLALKKLVASPNIVEDRVRLATIALAVCAAMQDGKMSMEFTALVWAECFQLDSSLWKKWIQHEDGISKESFYRDTVFGVLLEECRKDDNMAAVRYGRHIEAAVMDRIGQSQGNKIELSRLLRSVTVVDDAIRGESMIVSTY